MYMESGMGIYVVEYLMHILGLRQLYTAMWIERKLFSAKSRAYVLQILVGRRNDIRGCRQPKILGNFCSLRNAVEKNFFSCVAGDSRT